MAPLGPMLVRRLAEVGRADGGEVGNKSAILGELARAGVPVPAGFCITAAAYRQHVAQPGVAAALDAIHRPLAGYTGTEGAPPAAALLERLCRRIASTPLSPALTEAVLGAYADLGAGGAPARVAVRSAVIGGAGPEPARPDPYAAFLDIGDTTALLDAVRGCWASIWSEAALTYRTSQEIASIGLACAVLVQCMIPGAATGRYLVGEPGVVPSAAGARDLPEQEAALAGLGAQVAGVLGGPAVITWARGGEALSILNARPVVLPTPRAPRPRRARAPAAGRRSARAAGRPLARLGIDGGRLVLLARAVWTRAPRRRGPRLPGPGSLHAPAGRGRARLGRVLAGVYRSSGRLVRALWHTAARPAGPYPVPIPPSAPPDAAPAIGPADPPGPPDSI